MGKPKKKHKGKPHVKSVKAPTEAKKPGLLQRLAKNVAILIAVLFMLNWLKTNNPGYKWVVESQVIKSQKNLEKYKDFTMQQRLEGKLGFSVRYFDFIVKNTPDTAVILFPPDSIIYPKTRTPQMKNTVSGYTRNPAWVSYFLYPRKIVHEDRRDLHPGLAEKITHVAVLDYWGYEKLPYKVSQENQYSVMPIKIPQSK